MKGEVRTSQPINLMCMFLGCGAELENPEGTHTDTGRTRKLKSERPQVQTQNLLAVKQHY